MYGAIGRASSRDFDGGNNQKNNPIVLARTAVGISCPRVGVIVRDSRELVVGASMMVRQDAFGFRSIGMH